MSPKPVGLLTQRLREQLPADAVVDDRDIVLSYRADRAPWVPAGEPAVLVLPRTTLEVQAAVRVAGQLHVPIVVRGAGSGLSGGANAVDGCLVLCTSSMDEIVLLDVPNHLAVVQPGVLNAALSVAAAQEGLWYPPDPASFEFSSIGGNVATNAGGLCCVKYGVTADYVLGLEVVMADGSVVRTGRRTVKGVAGYDLTRLFVGSEGTLGIITEATLRLRAARSAPVTLAAEFPSLASAGVAVMDIMASGWTPALLELMDDVTVAAVDDWKNMGLDRAAAAVLLAQSDAGGAAGEEQVETFSECCRRAGASATFSTSDPREGEALLAVRRLAYPAMERLGATLLDDVAVPLSALPLLIREVQSIGAGHGLTIGTFGHAGDGNLHPTIVYDDHDAGATERARYAFGDIVRCALDLGGTITGEHGVGVLKREWLPHEVGSATMELHRSIKSALDPAGLLNPGKLFRTDGSS